MECPSTVLIYLPERFRAKEARSFKGDFGIQLRDRNASVVVDFSRLRDIDRCGLDTLVRCLSEVAAHDGAIRLAGVSPQAAIILELTQLDRIFDMFPRYDGDVPLFNFELVTSRVDSEAESDQTQLVPA